VRSQPHLGLEIDHSDKKNAKVIFRKAFVDIISFLASNSVAVFGELKSASVVGVNEVATKIAATVYSDPSVASSVVKVLKTVSDLCPYLGIFLAGDKISYNPKSAAEHALFFPKHGAVDTVFAKVKNASYFLAELGQGHSGLHWKARYGHLGSLTTFLLSVIERHPAYGYLETENGLVRLYLVSSKKAASTSTSISASESADVEQGKGNIICS